MDTANLFRDETSVIKRTVVISVQRVGFSFEVTMWLNVAMAAVVVNVNHIKVNAGDAVQRTSRPATPCQTDTGRRRDIGLYCDAKGSTDCVQMYHLGIVACGHHIFREVGVLRHCDSVVFYAEGRRLDTLCCSSLALFKRSLKTFLFRRTFRPSSSCITRL